ncbi:hypothetical protein [Kiloniella sp. b19]|uniref:hypothetical protein n=1 Tax=Kiloniella sp. GXU_MW_B19 TaxID=3141326 RepID=UPI0031DF0779
MPRRYRPLLLSLLFAGSTGCTEFPARDTRLFPDDRTVFFEGELETETVNSFLERVAELNPGDLERIVIRSGGGETRSARTLGRWVHRMGLDVEVEKLCFSSCANYIFPAGNAKIIRADAFVGWHGSETQFDVIALSDPDRSGADLERQELSEVLQESTELLRRNGLSKADFPRLLEEGLETSRNSRQDEAAFFDELGIDKEFTLHGMRPLYLHELKSSGKKGWTFSLADMKRLGLSNVSYQGTTPYTQSAPVQANLIVIRYIPQEKSRTGTATGAAPAQ